MKNILGFSLIETLIYIFLSSLLFITIFQFAVNNYNNYNIQHKSCTQQATLWNALDILDQDIRASLPGYKKQQKHEIIFSLNDYDISWKFHENKLLKTIGKYNIINNTWSDATESLVAKDLVNAEFQVSEDQKILKISLESKINNKPQKIEHYISTKTEIFIIPL